MRVLQLVLDNFAQVAVEQRFWTHALFFPVYSAVVLFVAQALVTVWRSQRDASTTQNNTHTSPVTTTQGCFAKAKEHIRCQGIVPILLKFLKLVGTLTLVGLTAVALFTIEKDDETSLDQTGLYEGWSEKHRSRGFSRAASAIFTHDEWIEFVYLGLYSYSSLLAFIACVSRPRWSFIAGTHLTLIMLAVLAIYAYRDLYPLATFTLKPVDGTQGWLLWSRIAVVSLLGVVIPSVIPRTYQPVDPLNPEKLVNPEQTASWLSFLTYTFLDPIILLAARTPHLPYESLPPLADYDRAEHLVARSQPILDPYINKKRAHLFWGLLRFFAWEYIQLAVMIVIKCFTGFMAPIGLKNLLSYLEAGGENAVIRPWVWILWLFLGPNIGSIAVQYYIFLATRMLVRTEGILTQLVFDHALRIRMKEEIATDDLPTTEIRTPETPSITEREGDVDVENADSEEETLQGSGSVSTVSLAQAVAKGKRKATKPADTLPSTAVPGINGAKSNDQSKSGNLVGKINNFVTTDLGNIVEGRDFLFLVLYGPLQVIVCAWFLYAILGWSALVGMGIMVLSVPLPGYVAKMLNKVQTERMKKTDARVQTVTEILSIIRMTKLFGWENKVNEQIAGKREVELGFLKKRQLLGLVNSNINFFFPLLTMLVTFACYTTIQKQDLTASTVFSSMAVFDLLRDVLHGTFYLAPMIINAKVSLGRINEFLLNTELLDRFTLKRDERKPIADPAGTIDPAAIGFRDATFCWGGTQDQVENGSFPPQYRLQIGGELFFKHHKLNLIIGPTGSGKTSLLMALLGEMHFEPNNEMAGFNLPREHGVAYAAQEGWLQNETIRENILFGKPYDQQRYEKVIYQCGLERDLSLFEGGDATEVGEKGLTLSGGQRARLTLARALYSDAAILLLDDILAALDVHTAKFIVDKCLQGDLLQDRTTILVTHNVAMVHPVADFVVSLGLDGRIASQGSVSDALTKDHRLLQEVAKINEVTKKSEEIVDANSPAGKDKQTATKLVVAEEIALGHVSWPALKLYISSMGGLFFWAVFLGGIFLGELVLTLSTWFLGFWASQYDKQPGWAVPVAYYLSIYALILISIMLVWSAAMAAYVFGSIKASRTIHRKLVESVLGTTLRWLDTVPTARVIARCTQDIRAVDGPINQNLSEVVELTMSLAIKFAAVMLYVPIFILPGISVFIVGGLCGQLYIKAQLSVKREMSNRRSPVLAHFGAAIAGLTSIRAYGAQVAFRTESLKRINAYSRPARTFYNCNRWICVRMDAIGGIFSAGLAAYLVYGNGLRTASNTGFSLTMAVGFSGMILWWVRVLNEFEVQGNSLERIEDYVNIEQEPKGTEAGKPPAYWPASGTLTVENLCARYSTDGPEVLHDISFEIKSGERVGVVGRTGSGKSSLTLSLLRCIPTEGRVVFDGLTTDRINLDALRSSITIIPQQPELLSGTLRENLDPFAEHSDATLNDALRAAGLFNLQSESDAFKITLDSSISSGGGNLSVGQRQILALARAIVRRSKLLILDEATSAIDFATDTIIQNTLREVLKDATLITVAHRLQTIMDADKIMVLDAGNLVEFDSPANLLKKSDGFLKSLVDESGDREALYKMAEKAERSITRG